MQFEVKINSLEDGELTPEGKSVATASVNADELVLSKIIPVEEISPAVIEGEGEE